MSDLNNKILAASKRSEFTLTSDRLGYTCEVNGISIQGFRTDKGLTACISFADEASAGTFVKATPDAVLSNTGAAATVLGTLADAISKLDQAGFKMPNAVKEEAASYFFGEIRQVLPAEITLAASDKAAARALAMLQQRASGNANSHLSI